MEYIIKIVIMKLKYFLKEALNIDEVIENTKPNPERLENLMLLKKGLLNDTKPISYFSAFSGIGGIEAAVPPTWTLNNFSEVDFAQLSTYFSNFPKHVGKNLGDITTIDFTKTGFDIFFGGFPCQPFSTIGNRGGIWDAAKGLLMVQTIRAINDVNPGYAILENVLGFAKPQFTQLLEAFAEAIGYEMSYEIYNSSKFLPNNRERIFILLKRKGLKGSLPRTESLRNLNKDTAKKYNYLSRLFTMAEDSSGNDTLYKKAYMKLSDLILNEGKVFNFDHDLNIILKDNCFEFENGTYYFKKSDPIDKTLQNDFVKELFDKLGHSVTIFKKYTNTELPTFVTTNSGLLIEEPSGNFRHLNKEELAIYQGFPSKWILQNNIAIADFNIGNSISPIVAQWIIYHLDKEMEVNTCLNEHILSKEEFNQKMKEILVKYCNKWESSNKPLLNNMINSINQMDFYGRVGKDSIMFFKGALVKGSNSNNDKMVLVKTAQSDILNNPVKIENRLNKFNNNSEKIASDKVNKAIQTKVLKELPSLFDQN